MLVAGCGFRGNGSPIVDGDIASDARSDGPKDDGRAVDGSPDTAAAADAFVLICPMTYNLQGGGSKYRLIPDGHRAWEQQVACDSDSTDHRTHLASIGSANELALLQGFVDGAMVGIAGDAVWIGATQAPNSAGTSDAWVEMSGASLFGGWQANEPNDIDGSEDGDEQFASLHHMEEGLVDDIGDTHFGAICECDGHAPATLALTYFASNIH